jgi:RHS repeat-associated protein
LIRVEEQGSTLGEYVYNGLGQRVIKEVNAESTLFHYDFNGNLIAESQADGIFTSEYLYIGQARLAIVDVAGNTMYYYLNNYLGTPVMMTDDQGMIVWEADFKPFGEAYINPNSEVVNNFRFPGQYYDAETGLHYNHFRYYDPKTGRYLTPDPIGLAGGINLFEYSKNNPINLVDPWGLQTGSVVRPSPRGLDPSFHPVFQPGTYENQLIVNDLNRVAWIVDPVPLLRDSGHFLYGGGLGYWIYDITHRPSIYGPDDSTNIEEWKKWKGVNPDELCEEKAEPWQPIMGGYDPEDPPPPSPNEPMWKKIARVIMKLIRAVNPK